MKTYETESIKYMGSKQKLLPYIMDIINRQFEGRNPFKEEITILDGFSGTTRVSQALVQDGYKVHANDMGEWSLEMGRCYLQAHWPAVKLLEEMLDYLNHLEPHFGWFSAHYGALNTSEGKMPWQPQNIAKLDAIRDEIDNIAGDIFYRSILLTSLMLALDKVDNTCGHYASYLKGWSKRSYNNLWLEMPVRYKLHWANVVSQEDTLKLIQRPNLYADLAYFDPPYGSNNEKMPSSRVRYNAYYHIWKTICLNDKPEIFGKCGRRIDSRDLNSDNPFEDYKTMESGKFRAESAVESLIKDTNAPLILLSYSSNGRLSKEILYDIIATHGKLKESMEIDYRKNIMSTFCWTNEWVKEKNIENKEYLLLIEK